MTTLKGADAGAYYVDALPDCYLDTDEPKGVWHGQAANRLGLSGDVNDAKFLVLLSGC